MRRILIILLCVSMMLSLFVACGDDGITTPSPNDGTASSPTPSDIATPNSEGESQTRADDPHGLLEDIPGYRSADILGEAFSLPGDVPPSQLPLCETETEISVWTLTPAANTGMVDYGENEAWIELGNRFNVKFKFFSASTTGVQESFTLHVASQDYADIMNHVIYYIGGIDKAVEDDVFVDLRDWVDYLPHYMAIVNENEENRRDAFTDGGRMGHFCRINYSELKASANGQVFRQDMADKAGLTSNPDTWDEWTEWLTVIRDTYNIEPLYLDPNGVNLFNSAMLTGLGLVHNYILRNGRVEYARITDEYRTYLSYMSQWYESGLMYRDFYTRNAGDSSTAMTELCCNDLVFTMQGWTAFAGTHYVDVGSATNPDFYISAIHDPTMVKGEKPIARQYGSSLRRFTSSTGWAVTTGAEENTELAMRIMDYFYSSEGILLVNYGNREGTSYEDENATFYYNGDRPTLTVLVNENPDGLSMSDALMKWYFHTDSPYLIQQRERDVFSPEKYETLLIWGDVRTDSEMSILPTNYSTTADEGSRIAMLMGDIETYVNEMTIRFITGEEPMSSWDAYLAQIESMNIKEVLSLQQTAVDRYMAKGR